MKTKELIKYCSKLVDKNPKEAQMYTSIGNLKKILKRLKKYEKALEKIAAEAYVSVAEEICYDLAYNNAWRKIAVERIDIAREVLND